MSTPINIKTFLLGDAPKNNPLTIQEMDQNLLNLKTAIQTVEDASTTLVNDMVSAEALARQAADNSERDFRIAGDAALDTRLDVVETSYVKKDGTVAMTGLLTLSSNIPLNQFNATPKIYVDKATPEFSEAITLSGNLTISATNFLTVAANNLYIFPNTASASWTVTLPSPASVPVGSCLHFYSQFALATRNLIISAPSNTIRSESTPNSFVSSITIYTGSRYTFISDGSNWIPYRHFTYQQSSNLWNNSPVLVGTNGIMWGGKGLNLTSAGNVGFTSNFSINTDGTKLNISQDESNSTVLLSIDRTTGQVIQNTNAPITQSNQLATKAYVDSVAGANSLRIDSQESDWIPWNSYNVSSSLLTVDSGYHTIQNHPLTRSIYVTGVADFTQDHPDSHDGAYTLFTIYANLYRNNVLVDTHVLTNQYNGYYAPFNYRTQIPFTLSDNDINTNSPLATYRVDVRVVYSKSSSRGAVEIWGTVKVNSIMYRANI